MIKQSSKKYEKNGVFSAHDIISTNIQSYSFYDCRYWLFMSTYIGKNFTVLWHSNIVHVYYRASGNFGNYMHNNLNIVKTEYTYIPDILSWHFLIVSNNKKQLYEFLNKLNFNKIYSNPTYKKFINYRQVIKILLHVIF